jgi:hypothetical protein
MMDDVVLTAELERTRAELTRTKAELARYRKLFLCGRCGKVGHDTDECISEAGGASDDDVFMHSRVDPRFYNALPPEMFMTAIAYLPIKSIVPSIPRSCKMLNAMVFDHPAGPLLWRDVADLNKPVFSGRRTALVRAVIGKAPMRHIKTLIVGGSTDVSKALVDGISLTFIKDDTIAELIRAGANPNITGASPLFRLASGNRVTAAEMLIDAGADINVFNMGWTPLRRAVQHNRVSMVRMLIARGARISDVPPLGYLQQVTTDHRIIQMLKDHKSVIQQYEAEKSKKKLSASKKRNARKA